MYFQFFPNFPNIDMSRDLNYQPVAFGRRTFHSLGPFVSLIRHDMMSVAPQGQYAGASIGMPMMVPMQMGQMGAPMMIQTNPGAPVTYSNISYGQAPMGAPYAQAAPVAQPINDSAFSGGHSAALYQQLHQPIGQSGTSGGAYSSVPQNIPDSTFFTKK